MNKYKHKVQILLHRIWQWAYSLLTWISKIRMDELQIILFWKRTVSFKRFSSNNAELANYKEKEETLLIIVLSNKDSLKVYIFLTQPFQTFTMNAMGKEALLVPPLFFIISWFLLVTKEYLLTVHLWKHNVLQSLHIYILYSNWSCLLSHCNNEFATWVPPLVCLKPANSLKWPRKCQKG